jgi:acetyl-CoA C-acetyltransferase
MARKVLIAGVAMMPFTPQSSDPKPAASVARAVELCLADACVDFELVDQIFTANASNAAFMREQAMASLGLTGTPRINISDGDLSGHTAFHLARQCVLSGEAECVLAAGFEVISAPAPCRDLQANDRKAASGHEVLAVDPALQDLLALRRSPERLFAAQMDALRSMLGRSEAVGERILAQARLQAHLNPYALLHGSQGDDGRVAPYLCPPAHGVSAVLLCSPEFARRYGLRANVASLASLRGCEADSDLQSLSLPDVLGRAATRRVACQAYDLAGLGPEEIDVVELHDQSVADYLFNSAALGFCNEAQWDEFSRGRHAGADGQVAICPSGGLLGRGHAPGATGLAQVAELVWQLRGEAGPRQIVGARTALQHGSALGRAVYVGILQRLF